MKRLFKLSLLSAAILSAGLLQACENSPHQIKQEAVENSVNAFPSTYAPFPSEPSVILGATVLTGTGEQIDDGAVIIENGKITYVGPSADATPPKGAVMIDGKGKFVTPGIIDIHSHLGTSPSPRTASTYDTNEAVAANTADVWIEHSVWPQDPGFTRALAGGVTSLQILPGSANLFGGRSVTLKNTPGRTVQGMKFPDAPYGMKMACGENPKRVYGKKGGPSTRMGNVAGYREDWIKAQAYKTSWDNYDGTGKPPKRDLKLETMAGVLSGDILVHMHCYRADEMVQLLDVAKEFDYKITSFQHAVEGYKVADYLAENGVCAAVWADWWGFKLEAYDGIRENAALIDAQENSCAIIHSDNAVGIQRLNQEAAKAMANGNYLGLEISPAHAISWITSNPAKAMGILDQTGTLEAGKMGDVVIWNGTPFSVYAQAEQVFIDGALLYDRDNPALSPRTDFEVGQLDNESRGGAGQ